MSLEDLEARWLSLIEECAELEDSYKLTGDEGLIINIATCKALIQETFEQMVSVDLLTMQALN